MVNIEFEYKDAYTFGKYQKQSCTVRNLEECIKIYGLDRDDVEYHILSIKEQDG